MGFSPSRCASASIVDTSARINMIAIFPCVDKSHLKGWVRQVYSYRLPLRTPDAHACSPPDLSSSKHLTIIHDQHLQVNEFSRCGMWSRCLLPRATTTWPWRFVLEVWDPMFCSFWLAIIAGKLITGLRLGICRLLGRLQTGFSIGSQNRPKDAPKISPKV